MLCGCRSFSSTRDTDPETTASKGLGSTLARAADTLRVALLGEKVDELSSNNTGGRNFSTENFELLPSSDDRETTAASDNQLTSTDNKKKFPSYQSASFRSWRMNIYSPMRYDSC